LQGVQNRSARFQSVIAFCDSEHSCQPLCFQGEVEGTITDVERTEQGKSGFGFDPIFQPKGCIRTFAEMTIAEKNGYSHRAAAIRKFAEWYSGK